MAVKLGVRVGHAKLHGEYCEYGEYCNACQAAVTVIRSSDTALKSCLEWLTMSYITGDSTYLIFSAVLQTERHG